MRGCDAAMIAFQIRDAVPVPSLACLLGSGARTNRFIIINSLKNRQPLKDWCWLLHTDIALETNSGAGSARAPPFKKNKGNAPVARYIRLIIK